MISPRMALYLCLDIFLICGGWGNKESWIYEKPVHIYLHPTCIIERAPALQRFLNNSSRDRITADDSISIDMGRRTIYLNKGGLSPEDIVAISFAEVLDRVGARYVIVAGYIAILFGRARGSDDVDFIVDRVSEDRFVALCSEAREKGFTLMRGDISSETAMRRIYRNYLTQSLGVRFMYRELITPNVEFKLAFTENHRYAIDNSYTVIINDRHTIRISPLELQIVYKLLLGLERDIGDAVFLYDLFKGFISYDELSRWCEELRVDCMMLEK